MSSCFKYEVPSALRGTEVAEALGSLPPWRLEKALTFRRPLDRFLCAKAYLLLRDALREVYGLEGDVTFTFGVNGKPALAEHPEIHFNLSHCSSCVCCAVSGSPVGIDVEDIQFDPDLAATVLNASELERVLASGRPDVEFTRLWTMKESLLKLRGTGICDDLKEILPEAAAVFKTEVNTDRGYVLCVAEASRH